MLEAQRFGLSFINKLSWWLSMVLNIHFGTIFTFCLLFCVGAALQTAQIFFRRCWTLKRILLLLRCGIFKDRKSKYSWGLGSLYLGCVWINMSAFCRWCRLSGFSGICIEAFCCCIRVRIQTKIHYMGKSMWTPKEIYVNIRTLDLSICDWLLNNAFQNYEHWYAVIKVHEFASIQPQKH